MLTISANCAPLRQSFGAENKKKIDPTELINQTTELLHELKNCDKGDQDSIDIVVDKVNGLNNTLQDSVSPTNPFGTVATAGAATLVTALVTKKFAPGVIRQANKNTPFFDNAVEGIEKGMAKIIKMTPKGEKTAAGFVKRNGIALHKKLMEFGKKDLAPENTGKSTEILKNGVIKLTQKTAVGAGALVGFIFGVKDGNGNGRADIAERGTAAVTGASNLISAALELAV